LAGVSADKRARGWLRKRAYVLTLVIILVVAAVFVYITRLVKPKRVRLRAGVLKIITFDFEADAGDQAGEPDGRLGGAEHLKGLSLTSDKDDAVLQVLAIRVDC
jgi:hypothetical protein